MSNQPVKNQEYIFYITLVSRATGQWQVNPTIAAEDFKVSTDGGAYDNLGTLPSVDPVGSRSVKVTLSASEMNGSNVNFQGVDAAGNEWDDVFANFQPLSWIDANDRVDVGKVAGTTQTPGDIIADTNDIQNRLPAALSGDGFMKADLKSIEDELTSGNNATLNLKRLSITNNSGDAVAILATGGGGMGMKVQSTANMAVLVQSTVDDGIDITAVGVGLNVDSSGNNAAKFTAYALSDGILCSGGDFGIRSVGDVAGVSFEGNAFGAHGMQLDGIGTGKSINAPDGIIGSDAEDLSVTNITDKNWDETIAGHLTAGSTGNALNAAGAAGDPWTTMLPGAYGAGTAGDIIGNRLDMPISDVPTANENADALLKRDWTAVTGEAARSVLNALRKIRNKVSFDGVNTLTITKEDDATTAYTQGVVEDANQDPFKEVG